WRRCIAAARRFPQTNEPPLLPFAPTVQQHQVRGGIEGHPVTSVVKKFQCEFCGKGFQWQSNLQLHVRTHTGEKPYPCPQCPYRAVQRSDLTKHLRIHTGEKPYSCSLCPYRAAYASSLRDHSLLHHSTEEQTSSS
ncbi:hypothetical protein SK128_018159, partial [Halocaridina rubra]